MIPWIESLRADTEAAGAEMWTKIVDPTARDWEPDYLATAQREFRAEEVSLAFELLRAKAVPDWVKVGTVITEVLKSREADWRAGFIPLFQAQMEQFGDEWAVQLGVDFALVNPAVQEFVDTYTFQFVERHQGVTRDALAALIGQGQAEGWDVLKLIGSTRDGSGLRGLYAGWEFLRAEMIARTETIRVENAGSLAAYQAAGITEVEWYTAEDDRVCPFCGKLHHKKWAAGQPLFKLGDEFRVDDQVLKLNYEAVVYPPLHVFCRCTLLPVV